MAAQYGGITLISHPLIVEVILPFLLVFTVVFGVLQKSEIFGKEKKQIDAIVALVVGLIVISFAKAIGIIVQLSAFLAVMLVIILVFMLLVGAFNKEGDKDSVFSGFIRKVIGIPAIIAFFAAVIYLVGAWDYIKGKISELGEGSSIVQSIVFLVIIVAAVWFVIKSGAKEEKSEKKKD